MPAVLSQSPMPQQHCSLLAVPSCKERNQILPQKQRNGKTCLWRRKAVLLALFLGGQRGLKLPTRCGGAGGAAPHAN